MLLERHYKHTEVGPIPSDWQTKPCSAISTLITVGIVIRPAQYYVSEGVPALRSANIREDRVTTDGLVFISEKANAFLAKSQVRAGDVLTVRTGYPGTSAVVPPSLAGANCIDILITRPSNTVSPGYLSAWINSPFGKHQVLRNQGGLAQQHFNVGDLRNLIVALPPTKAEQDAIADALSDADAFIQSLEQLLAKKRAVMQGALQDLLTGKRRLPGFGDEWTTLRLGTLGVFLKGRGITRADVGTGPVPCVRYGELYTTHNSVVSHCVSHISRDVAKTATRLMFGDILFAGSGETKAEIGKCAAFLVTGETYAGGDIVIFRPTNLDSRFLGYYLNSPQIATQKASKAQGDAVVHISAAALADLEVTVPDLNEQEAISLVLSDMDAEIAYLEAKVSKARDIKQGMMQDLLTGRVRLV